MLFPCSPCRNVDTDVLAMGMGRVNSGENWVVCKMILTTLLLREATEKINTSM